MHLHAPREARRRPAHGVRQPSAGSPTAAIPSIPGGDGDLGGTYLGTIIIYWTRQLLGLPAVVETAGFTPLVNGNDLAGWEGDTQLWSARDGVLDRPIPGPRSQRVPGHRPRPYGDFVLSLNFRMRDGKGNSGVQFRSVRIPGHEMYGYQADLGEGYWGASTTNRGGTWSWSTPGPTRSRTLNRSDWNRYVIRAMGDRITLTLNGQDSVRDYQEADSGIDRSGFLAVQIHAGGPMEIQFRDLMIQPLPTPTADNPNPAGFPPADGQDRSGGAEIHGLRARGLRWLEVVSRDPVPPRRGRTRRGRDHPGPGGARAGDPQSARRHSGARRLPAGTPHLVGRLDR